MIGLARIEEKITGMNANVLELTVQMKETNSRLGATCEKVACLELSQEQLAKDQEAHENRQKAINGAVGGGLITVIAALFIKYFGGN